MTAPEVSVKVTHTVTVECVATGPVIRDAGVSQAVRATTLTDLETFCSELRRWGAPDGTRITQPGNLSAVVTLPPDPGPAGPGGGAAQRHREGP